MILLDDYSVHPWQTFSRPLVVGNNPSGKTMSNQCESRKWQEWVCRFFIHQNEAGKAEVLKAEYALLSPRNHTDSDIFYLVLLRFMGWTENERTPGPTPRRVPSGSKTFSHATYLMPGWWHLDTTLMQHLAIQLQASKFMLRAYLAVWLTSVRKMMWVAKGQILETWHLG